MDQPLPAKIEVYYSSLPKASRERIAQMARDSRDIHHVSNPGPTGIFLGAIALGVLLLMKFHTVAPLAFILAGAIVWLVGTRVIAPTLFFSPFHYLHSAFLLDAGYGLLVAYPIWHLTSVEVTHRLVNGSYRHSDVRMVFGGADVQLTAKSREQGEALARLALSQRDFARKMIELDALSSVEGWDLVPASVVSSEPRTSRAWLVFVLAVIAGVAAALWLPPIR